MYRLIKMDSTNNPPLQPCPFCGGAAEWIGVPGDDCVMRCSKCHASTQHARWTLEEAANDWNSGDVCDDHFSITADKRIDEYLNAGVKSIFFSGYSFDDYPPYKDGFLCSNAIIVTDSIVLCVEPEGEILLYDEICSFNPELYRKPIAQEGTPITLIKSRWSEGSLMSLLFQCGDRAVKLCANAAEECIYVREKVEHDKGMPHYDK